MSPHRRRSGRHRKPSRTRLALARRVSAWCAAGVFTLYTLTG